MYFFAFFQIEQDKIFSSLNLNYGIIKRKTERSFFGTHTNLQDKGLKVANWVLVYLLKVGIA